MEKPFLSGSIKVDEESLKKIFIFNLNQTYSILLYLGDYLPILAKAACYGDLENVIEEFLSEVNIQSHRISDIFILLKEVPVEKNNFAVQKLLPFLVTEDADKAVDGLLKDLSLVFYLQRVVALKHSYFFILKSISNSLNNTNIKQYLQYNFKECEENQVLFKLIAKEYKESSINVFLQ